MSSSSPCHAARTDIPDPLSPLLPIVHHLWQVFRATSRILTELLNIWKYMYMTHITHTHTYIYIYIYVCVCVIYNIYIGL